MLASIPSPPRAVVHVGPFPLRAYALAIILGVAETIVLTLFGASWAPAISFAMLLGVLAVRPQGLFGRRS